jgi:L-threonylcarbamoyladenylate synthase
MILPADAPAIERAAELLRAGGLVAFPTETVYGLGARADDASAVRRIYEAKGRPANNPSIVHVVDADAAFALAAHVPDVARALAARHWPGPLTLILQVAPGAVAAEVTARGTTIAVRVPAHPVALALLRASRLPLAAPSANRSTSISPTTAQHVQKSLGDRVDLILDGGPTGFGIESTIIDATTSPVRVLRRGSIAASEIRALGVDVVDGGTEISAASEIARSPGTQERHYAPITPLELVREGELARALSEASRRGERVAAIVRGPSSGAALGHETVTLADEPRAYAAGLYAALHQLDEASCTRLLVEVVPETSDWDAVRDRLTRASHKV